MHASQRLCLCVLLNICVYTIQAHGAGAVGHWEHMAVDAMTQLKEPANIGDKTFLSTEQQRARRKSPNRWYLSGQQSSTAPCSVRPRTFQTANKRMMPLTSGVVPQPIPLFSRAAPPSKSLINLHAVFRVNTPRKGNHKTFINSAKQLAENSGKLNLMFFSIKQKGI